MKGKVDTTVSGRFPVPTEAAGEELARDLAAYGFGGLWWVSMEEGYSRGWHLLFSDVDAHDTKRAQWFLEGWLYARGLSIRQKESVS